jgi:hypothetical protein
VAINFCPLKANKRVASRIKKPVKCMALFSLWFASQVTYAQFQTGTVVVFQLTKVRFVVAADSRATFVGKNPQDTSCKIAAFKNHLVFATAGATTYPAAISDLSPSWSSINEAKSAILFHSLLVGSQTSEVMTTSIADQWARNMVTNWQILSLHHPEKIREAAERGHGILTQGLFALAFNEQITITTREIDFQDGRVVSSAFQGIDNCMAGPCAFGRTEIFVEFNAGVSERAKKDSFAAPADALKKASFELLRAIHLVDLTIAYDKSEEVGGAIDAIELFDDGSVHWYQKKENCPDYSD